MATIRMKPIIPKNINKRALFDELEKEMKAIQKEVAKDFDSTVKTWDNQPKFDKEFESSKSRIRIFVGTGDAIYGYVSEGTKPHRIMPKRGKVLRFQGTYTAKTAPGVKQWEHKPWETLQRLREAVDRSDLARGRS